MKTKPKPKNNRVGESIRHSSGEIKNANGFTTNPIESKWSLMKRWVRKKFSRKWWSHSSAMQSYSSWRPLGQSLHCLNCSNMLYQFSSICSFFLVGTRRGRTGQDERGRNPPPKIPIFEPLPKNTEFQDAPLRNNAWPGGGGCYKDWGVKKAMLWHLCSIGVAML